MKHLDLFSGIGGFALAASQVWEDYETVGFCDNDRFCQAILRKRFPGVPIYDDIRALSRERFIADTYGNGQPRDEEVNADNGREQTQRDFEAGRRPACDLITGGFPCQPFSQAGKRKGTADNRYLWPEMLRVIREFAPRWVIGENVRGLLNIEGGVVFEQVCLDLEAIGYEVQAFVIPACAVNAPHRRDRVWIVAHSNNDNDRGRREQIRKSESGDDTNSDNKGLEGSEEARNFREGRTIAEQRPGKQVAIWQHSWLNVATATCDVRVDDGLPASLDGLELSKSRHRVERLKSLGNSIVPQVAVEIMKAVKFADSQ